MSGGCLRLGLGLGLMLGIYSHHLLVQAAVVGEVPIDLVSFHEGVSSSSHVINTTTTPTPSVVFMEGQKATNASILPHGNATTQKTLDTNQTISTSTESTDKQKTTNATLPTIESSDKQALNVSIPVHEEHVEEQQTSSVHARKGVEDPPPSYSVRESTTSTPNITATTNATTPKMIPRKPTITVGGDANDDPADLEPVRPIPQSSTPEMSSNHPKVDASSTSHSIEYLQLDKSSTVAYKADNHIISNSYFDHLPKSQPGFIIPLIISMFAVPVLALIGYQAVRRGKEAWRNRHYRRMDYLIDGMYNDS